MISPEVLRRFPYFTGASESSMNALAMITEEKSFGAGDAMFEDGQPAKELYIVTRGAVDIQYVLNSGERRTVDTLVPGDLLAWSAVVAPFKATACGVAREDTEVLAFDSDAVRRLMREDHDLGFNLMTEVVKVLAHRLQGARVQLATLG